MAPCFSKHTILSGAVDYYCLVCENRFLTAEDTSIHIKSGTHQQQLKIISYETQEDGIRKIKMWYYCEFCSVVLKTKPKVRLHILDAQHVANKSKQYLKRYGNIVIAFDSLQINNNAWDGLCDSTCILCNSEYEDVSEHLKDPVHHINLIQSNIEFSNKNIFRMVDESSFHCITCNSLEALPANSHFDSEKHKKLYIQCQVLAAETINNSKSIDEKILPDKQTQDEEEEQNKSDKVTSLSNQTEIQTQGKVNISVTKATGDEKVNPLDKIPNEAKITKETVNKASTSLSNQTEIQTQGKVNISVTKAAGDEKVNPLDKIPKEAKITKDVKITKETVDKGSSSPSHKEIENSTFQTHSIKAKPNEYKNKNKFDFQAECDVVCKVLKTHNYIVRDGTKSAWCILCDWEINEQNINHHVSDVHHMDILKLHEMRIEQLTKQEREDNIHSELVNIVTKLEKKPNNVSKKNTLFSSPVLLKNAHQTLPEPQHILNKAMEKTNLMAYQKIHNALEKFKNNDMSIDFEKKSAACKKCSATVSFDFESIERHIVQHKEKVSAESTEGDAKQISDSTQLPESHTNTIDLLKFQTEHFDINFETKRVICKKCSVNLDFDDKVIEKHLDDHKKDTKDEQKVKQQTDISQKVSAPKITEDENFANANNFNIVLGQRIVSCDLCKTQVSFSLKHMKEHLHSNSHKSLVEGNKIKIETTILETFVQEVVMVKNEFFHDLILNNDICINIMSFNLLTKCPEVNMYRCLCCGGYINENEIETHIKTKEHVIVMATLKIVTNVKDEFIRQVILQHTPCFNYHCGYCNILVKSWQEMATHLATNAHKECKTSAKWRLHGHTSFIAGNRQDATVTPRFTLDILKD